MNILLAKILPSNQQQIIEQTKFTYSPLGKALDKQIKTIEGQGETQVDALNTLKPNNNKLKVKKEDIIPEGAFASDETKEELHKILKIEKTVAREKLVYKAGKYEYDFRNFNAIRTFGEDISNGKITLEEADEDQSDLTDEINEFTKNARPRSDKKKQKGEIVKENLYNFFKAMEMVLNGSKSKIFLTESTGTGILNTHDSKLTYNSCTSKSR